ncbi:fimV-related transmembrane protein [Vibrio ishigakensis]|uniref:FimV-related transmembrane protein n=2 Tax=Vibrio ishigakensis TaxID=1481914 RepID=A0A0B8NUF5_9VIBR|nr:fimV-related transmembrane protein [Vibrio ishigakensis]
MSFRVKFVALMALITLATPALAEEIRLTGPDGELQAVPTYIVPDTFDGKTVINRAENKISIERTYGPTGIDETLWSIASKAITSEDQSVYKMVLAIYRANPTAFEDRNIHLLKPGSTISIPTEAEVDKQSESEAIRLMKIHERKPSYLAKLAQENGPTRIQVEDSGARAIQDEQIAFLKQQLQSSQKDSQRLQQNNQNLMQQLSSIRTDVVDLKGKLELEAERRSNFEQQIIQSRTTPAEPESLLTNVWVIVALSVVITALIMLLMVRMTLSSVKALPNLANENNKPKELNSIPASTAAAEQEIESAEAKPKADDEPVQHVVSPLDQEFEQKLDEILAKENQVEEEEPEASEEKETWRDEDLPEYGEEEALAEALAETDDKPVQEMAESEASIQEEKAQEKPEPEKVEPKKSNYKSIDDILAENDSQPQVNPDEEDLDLRVGLDEFPDVIGKVELTDVDERGEIAGLIDLASVYIQMNDFVHATKLLQTVIDKGDSEQKQQAQTLLDSISK